MTDNNETLVKAIRKLCRVEAYYGFFLMGLDKKWTEKIPTSGVGRQGINVMLYINELFWESLTDLWKLYVLKHDVLHVVFHHIEVGEDLHDKHVATIASNIVVNQYIDPTWIPLFDVRYKDFMALNQELMDLLRTDLEMKRKTREEVIEELKKIPPRGVYLQDFHELNLEPLQGLKYYYDKLLEAKDKEPGKGGSQCLNDSLKDLESNFPVLWDHDWKDMEGMTSAEKRLFTAQVDYHMREVAEEISRARGTVPSEISMYLDSLDKKEPPRFDWKRYMRRFAGGSAQTVTKVSRRKENIKFPDSGGIVSVPKTKGIIYVDTSGSHDDKALQISFHEIYHMTKMGIEIDVAQFDAAIHSITKFRRGMEEQIKITGRGGTDFQPAIDHFNDNQRKYSFAMIITDGECPAPERQRGRVLWVLTPDSRENNSLKPQIKLN